MALKKTVQTNDCCEAEYHRILEIRNPIVRNGGRPTPFDKGMITVQVWKDAETRTLAKTNPKIVCVQTDMYPITSPIGSVGDGYTYLKTLETFNKAVDC